MGFETTIANSFRITVPAGIMNQFSLKEGDKLNWILKTENGDLIIKVEPIPKK